VARSRSALTAHREIVMIRDAGRHVDAQRFLRLDPAVSPARGARIRDDGALSSAGGARRDGEELTEERLRLTTHLPRAPAGPAGCHVRPRLGAAPPARGARLERLDPHLLRRPGRDLVERQPQGDLQVRPTTDLPLLAPAAAEDRVEATQVPEVAHEDVERFGEIEVREAEPARAPAPQPGLAVAIVGGPFVGVAAPLVRFGDLLELVLGRFVPAVAVGVEFHREATIRLLDLCFGG